MVSPSRRRLNLMVPCDAGCDGPIWISVISLSPWSVSWNRSGMSVPGVRSILAAVLPREPRLRDGIALGNQGLPLVPRVVLAQRVALELRVHEDAPQVGVADEADAVHVPDLALGPQGRVPQRRGARDRRIPARHLGLHAQPVVVGEGV